MGDGELAAVTNQLYPTTDPDQLSSAEAVVISVPAPLTAEDELDPSAVADMVGSSLGEGVPVVLQSTVPPGTTAQLAPPLGERIDPANRARWTLANTPNGANQGVPGSASSKLPRFSGRLPPLLGRDMDLLSITAHLRRSDAHLYTLTGAGGVGKSRLAIAAANDTARSTSRSIVITDLHEVDTGEDMLRALASSLIGAFGRTLCAGAPVTVENLAASIPDEDVLLILDGCEQVTDTAAAVVRELLAFRYRLRVLATSRRPLALYGERLLPVYPLPTPQYPYAEDMTGLQEYASVALFVDRARAVDPSFALTTDNARPVAEICARMDGLPLAIELTAERLRLFPVSTLVARLGEGSQAPVGKSLGKLRRHRSLHALTETSYRLLDEEQRHLLTRLAVCTRDIGLHTVEDIGGLSSHQTEHLLQPLVDLNLVTVRHGVSDPRFAMLETVRVFCMDQLRERGELAEARRGHAEHFHALAERAGPHLAGPDQAHWMGVVESDHDNLRHALTFLREDGRHDEAAAITLALHRFWLSRGHLRLGARYLTEAIEAPPSKQDRSPLTGPLESARGMFASALGDVHRATESFQRAAVAYRESRDPDGEHAAIAQHAVARHHAGERLDSSSTDYLIRIASRDDAHTQIAAAALAMATSTRDAPGLCQKLLTAALQVYKRHQDVRGIGLVFAEQAELAVVHGDFAVAERLLRLSLEQLRAIGERTMLPVVLATYAHLLWLQIPGQEHRVVRLMAASSALRKATHASPFRARGSPLADPLPQLRRHLGRPRFETLWYEGQLLTPDATVAEMLAAPRLAAVRSSPTSQDAKLTPRQYQIASLVSQGLTNRQIAHQLQISEWTAVNHVRQIMHKLQLPSRIHVAQWMLKAHDGERE